VESEAANATTTSGWSSKEAAWCFAAVLPLFTGALWCLLSRALPDNRIDSCQGAGSCSDPGAALALRCHLLRQLIAIWQAMQSLSFDHLRNQQLLWSALDEARLRAAASLATTAPLGDSDATVPIMEGSDFFEAVQSRGLHAILGEAGGLVKVINALPGQEATHALSALKELDEESWMLSANQRREDADHRFWRYEGPAVDNVKRLLADLAPGLHPNFNAARYNAGGRITLHNDARCWTLEPHEVTRNMEYPVGTEVFRKVAVICYLTQDWCRDYGGCLVDNLQKGPQQIVPKFNSLVCFLVPREHWVTEVQPIAPLRYTIFGWLSDAVPYPENCPPPLGSGNGDVPAIAAAKHEDAGSIGKAQTGVAEGEGAAVAEAVRAAAEARRQCEQAFEVRFGITPQELQLGQTNSPAASLLEKLHGCA